MRPPQTEKKEGKENSVNLLATLTPYLKKWYFFLFSVIIGIGIAYVYLKFSLPTYRNETSVLINEDKSKPTSTNMQVLEDLDLVSTSTNLNNEIEIFKAFSVLEPVVDSLQLYVAQHLIGDNSKVRTKELYSDSPIQLKIEDNPPKNIELIERYNFNISILDGKEILISSGNLNKKIRFNSWFRLSDKHPPIFISKTKNFKRSWFGKKIDITVVPKERAIFALGSSLTIEKKNKESSVLTISIKGSNWKKNNEILQQLIKSYQRDVMYDKNIVKLNTSNFIKDRLIYLMDELAMVEIEGQSYKQGAGVADYEVNLTSTVDDKSNLERELNESNLQLSLVNMLLEYTSSSNSYDDLVPTNLGFVDLSIKDLCDEYNKAVLDRKKLLETSKTSSPVIIKIENQLASLKSNLEKSLRNLKQIYVLKCASLEKRFNILNRQLGFMPKFEREYRAILRQQQIKESLYLFLLQKREENEIELAASVGSLKVIKPPIQEGVKIAPSPLIIYALSFFISFLIPFVGIFIYSILYNKVLFSSDIQGLNVIGEIPQSDAANQILDRNQSNVATEAFRMLRANISFFTEKRSGVVLGITSSIPNEGKTFISINLAQALGNTEKKVILIGMDLRKPKFVDYFSNKLNFGLSNFLVDKSLSLDSIINAGDDVARFDYIFPGDIPPNPSELLLRTRLDDLMEELRQRYDYILFDTSPIGIISDCLPVLQYHADLVLYVTRAGFSDKKFLELPKTYIKDGIFKNLVVILNDAKSDDLRYSYKYGYYDYYTHESKVKLTTIQKVMNFLKGKTN